MTDQGSESDNQSFIDAINSYGITHLLAQTKSTPVSNSMVERMFASIRKYIRVKFQNDEITKRQLKKVIAEFVTIHNFELPLYNFKKTPSEVYWQATNDLTFNFKDAFSKAILNRKESNTLLKCIC